MAHKKTYINIVWLIFAYVFFSPIFILAATVNAQADFFITEEDIKNAIPTPKEVNLTKKMTHDVEVMEERHFGKINDYDEAKYRIAKLEEYLLKRTWEFSKTEERLHRLKLASQRKMLSGTSLPASLNKHFSPKRIANDSTPVYEDEDNVGILDGLLKLYAPDIYYGWSEHKKRVNEIYFDDG